MNSSPADDKPRSHAAEKEFYFSYDWCLNPIPPMSDLFELLEKELRRLVLYSGCWESREVRINLHLFAGAISCLIDDYLSWFPLQLQPLKYRFADAHIPFVMLERIANLPFLAVTYFRHRRVHLWRQRWTHFVDEIHDLLLSERPVTEEEATALIKEFRVMRQESFPKDLLHRRMRIIEGYRCQDLTHYDICALADRYIDSSPDRTAETFIIGPRTAGAYFAPVVRAYLVSNGFKSVSWMTVRPKRGLTSRERKEMRRHVGVNVRVVLTDDHSSTGLTFELLQRELSRLGVQPSRITLLAPIHPRRPHLALAISPETRVIRLLHPGLYKQKSMECLAETGVLLEIVRTSIAPSGEISTVQSPETGLINDRFGKETANSFQVRLKRLYDVRCHARDGSERTVRILAKSVGWGWLGYHAYIAGTQLHGFVPRILGLREGILFMEWIDHPAALSRRDRECLNAERIGLYVARRREVLKLREDPRSSGPEYGWGWQEIVSLLRRPYGIRTGYLKNHVLYRRLERHTSPAPTLIDGRMYPVDWLHEGERMVKSDFEHHNFGPPNLEMADPIFDLAAASFEWGLSENAESSMLNAYRNSSHDETLNDRLILLKILYARVAQRLAHVELLSKDSATTPAHNHLRYAKSWDFLVLTMMRFCSGMIRSDLPFSPSGNVLFLDIDGVLDTGFFGFPHTTPHGMAALALLRRGGCSVLPNSGRSVLHIREYCKSFGFEAGAGEYGSVLVWIKGAEEIPLASPAALEQIADCRAKLEDLPGVFLDPSYRYSLRAYRFGSSGTFGLSRKELEEILNRNKYHLLRIISHQSDSYIVSAEVDKAKAALALKESLGYPVHRTAAIGNSDDDLSMLAAADLAFAPSNSSKAVRELGRKGRCHIVRRPNQSGLLAATRFLLSIHTSSPLRDFCDSGHPGSLSSLMFTIMMRMDQSRLRRFLVLLRRNAL